MPGKRVRFGRRSPVVNLGGYFQRLPAFESLKRIRLPKSPRLRKSLNEGHQISEVFKTSEVFGRVEGSAANISSGSRSCPRLRPVLLRTRSSNSPLVNYQNQPRPPCTII